MLGWRDVKALSKTSTELLSMLMLDSSYALSGLCLSALPAEIPKIPNEFYTGVARKRMPSDCMTLRTVANSGLPSSDKDL